MPDEDEAPIDIPEPPTDDMFAQFLGELNEQESVGQGPEPISEEELPPLDTEGIFGDISQGLGDGECDVCGAPTFRPPGLTKAGRKKRIPKRCDLHSTNVRVSGERPDLTGVESQLRRVQEELADDIRLLGTLAGPLLPVTGYYVFDHADPFTIALLKLAKNNTRVLRVLHRAAQVAPIYTVAECVAGTAYAVQVDQHKADPHSGMGRRLGVERAFNSVYPEAYQSNITNNGFEAPPRYATVQ